ncbi:hypothetical protein DFH09DRAFT_1106042 [Mycena vulgaris]|nr:hypothetical protein DFH09DRAFT_1106042 [Mycena vulgaris]
MACLIRPGLWYALDSAPTPQALQCVIAREWLACSSRVPHVGALVCQRKPPPGSGQFTTSRGHVPGWKLAAPCFMPSLCSSALSPPTTTTNATRLSTECAVSPRIPGWHQVGIGHWNSKSTATNLSHEAPAVVLGPEMATTQDRQMPGPQQKRIPNILRKLISPVPGSRDEPSPVAGMDPLQVHTSARIVLYPKPIAMPVTKRDAQLLPGGHYVLFNNSQVLECWRVADVHSLCKYQSPSGRSVFNFSADFLDGGEGVNIDVYPDSSLRTFAGTQIAFACQAAGPHSMLSNGSPTCSGSTKEDNGEFIGTTGKVSVSYTTGTESSVAIATAESTAFTVGGSTSVGINYLFALGHNHDKN